MVLKEKMIVENSTSNKDITTCQIYLSYANKMLFLKKIGR